MVSGGAGDDVIRAGRPVARSMALLLIGALMLVNGCPTSDVKRRTGRPEAFAAAFDVTTGRQLWATRIRPPISGMYAAAMEEDNFVVDGFPPMRDCALDDFEIALDGATGAEVTRGRVRKFVEHIVSSTGPVIAHDESAWYRVQLQAGHQYSAQKRVAATFDGRQASRTRITSSCTTGATSSDSSPTARST